MTTEEARIILKFHRPDRPRSTDRRQLQKAIDVILDETQTDERLKKIANHYGLDSQLDILLEECGELIQAVSKYKRTGSSNIVEELADVEIMISQIKFLMTIPSQQIEEMKEQKIRRQLVRMKGGAE